MILHENRPALGIQFTRPILARKRLAHQELARFAIQHIEERIAIRLHNQFAIASFPFEIEQHGRFRGIPIVQVVRRELKMPLELAGIRIKRNQRTGV